MEKLKEYGKYILWIVGGFILSSILIYIGLNATYKNMLIKGKLPDQVVVDIGQATKVNGRIYGEVTSTEENNLNGKFLEVEIYNKRGEVLGRKYLEITGTQINSPKKFKVNFVTENVRAYGIKIIDSSDELKEEIEMAEKLWAGVFTDEDIKGFTVILLILGLTYGI